MQDSLWIEIPGGSLSSINGFSKLKANGVEGRQNVSMCQSRKGMSQGRQIWPEGLPASVKTQDLASKNVPARAAMARRPLAFPKPVLLARGLLKPGHECACI